MRRVDRSSAADARFVLESLISGDADRRRWLDLLADAVEAADRVHRGSWAITLFDEKLRMNVGKIETVVFRPGHAMLVLDASLFSDAGIFAMCTGSLGGRLSNYASVPGTVNVYPSYDVDPCDWSDLRPALLTLVERAASLVQTRTNFFTSHSPGVIEYLGLSTGRSLRQPDHRSHGAPRRRRGLR